MQINTEYLAGNQEIKITGEKEINFRKALWFFFEGCERENCWYTMESYSIIKQYGLLIGKHSTTDDGWQKLPFEMDYQALCDFAWNWFKSLKGEDIIPNDIDIDGSITLGWKIKNYVTNYEEPNADIIIKPYWLVYGK